MYLLVLILFLFLDGCARSYDRWGNPSDSKYTSSARHKVTMRSYTIRGKRYRPSYVQVGQVMKGIASWYGPHFHGKRTSNGEVYNMHGRTAAHKTWPMDTMVRVRNLKNGKSTVVRINDRGPFVRGRVIDCSYRAGKELGLDKMGVARVSIKVVGFAGKIYKNKKVSKTKFKIYPIKSKSKTKPKSKSPRKIRLSNFAIQVGAFSSLHAAKKAKSKYALIYKKYGYRPKIKKFRKTKTQTFYRLWLMGFASKAEAEDFKGRQHLDGAFIVRE
jgi:rare lipoprotein A